MNKKAKYGVFAASLLWPFLGAALTVCLNRLPTTDPANPLSGPSDSFHNWVGHGVAAAYGYALLLLVIIYSAKFLIGYLPIRWVRIYCFVLLVTASLPYIWFLIVLDWRNPFVYRVACWVYDPIGVWFIPAISFTADTIAMRSPRLLWYVERSSIEFVLIVPWVFVWAYISFFFLGGGWF